MKNVKTHIKLYTATALGVERCACVLHDQSLFKPHKVSIVLPCREYTLFMVHKA